MLLTSLVLHGTLLVPRTLSGTGKQAAWWSRRLLSRRLHLFLLVGDAERFGLPLRVFLYTVDQIATLLQVDDKTVKTNYLHYEERSVGFRPHDRMSARNIAPNGEKPDWRVAEAELVRWLRYKGFKIYNRTSVLR